MQVRRKAAPTSNLLMAIVHRLLRHSTVLNSTKVVSGMVENLHRKKFSPARIGVGGCHLSVRLSVTVTLSNNF
jgi:hypothetical protein